MTNMNKLFGKCDYLFCSSKSKHFSKSVLIVNVKNLLINMSVFFVGKKEKCRRVFSINIHKADFHPKEQIRMALLSLIVITVFLILNRAICLEEMEK